MILGGHFLIGEVAPAAPLGGAAALYIAGIGAFLAFIVCWGLREGWDATIGYGLRWIASKIRGVDISFGWFGDVHPFGFLADVFEAVDKNVSHALAVAALNTEHAWTWCFATAGEVVAWTGREIAALAEDTYHAFAHVYTATLPRWRRDIIHEGEHLIELGLAKLGRELGKALHGVLDELHSLSKYLTHRVTVVEHTIAHTLPRIKTIEDELANVEAKLRDLAKAISTPAIVALIGATIWKLLPRFFRCPSFTKAGNRLGCFGWSVLDDILAGAIDVLVVSDLCRLTHLMIDLAESAPVQDTLYGIVNGLDDLIDCQGVGLPAPLSGYWTAPPPPQAFSVVPQA